MMNGFAEKRSHIVAVRQAVYPQGRTAHGCHSRTAPKELCRARDLRAEGVFGVIIHSLKGHVSTIFGSGLREFTNPKTHPSSPSPPQWRFGISTTSRVVLFT